MARVAAGSRRPAAACGIRQPTGPIRSRNLAERDQTRSPMLVVRPSPPGRQVASGHSVPAPARCRRTVCRAHAGAKEGREHRDQPLGVLRGPAARWPAKCSRARSGIASRSRSVVPSVPDSAATLRSNAIVRPGRTTARDERRPGAVEQPISRCVSMLAKATSVGSRCLRSGRGHTRHVQRQRPMRAEKAEEAVGQPPGGRPGRVTGCDGRGREGQLRLLAEPHAILTRPPRDSQGAAHREIRLDHPQAWNRCGSRAGGELREMRQIIRASPLCGLHRAISPRCWVVRTVSVKLLIVTYLRKNRSSTAPRT
jgi:hypothetical protein